MTDWIPLARPLLGKREEHLVLETLRSGRLSLGPRLADRDEIATEIDELWAYATTDGTLASIPRVVQTWARNPG